MKQIRPSVVTPAEWLFSVTANFTAEPLEPALRYWIGRLGLPSFRIEFSGYNQVFQELMAPGSLLASAEPGVSMLLIRLEDWSRDQPDQEKVEKCTAGVRQFTAALTAFAKRASRPTILFVAPPSARASADVVFRSALADLESHLESVASALPGVRLVRSNEVAQRYPVATIDDGESDRVAHIPFTSSYWTAIASALARKVRSLCDRPYKVLVVDGDNTLWGGVIGESGPEHVRVDGVWRDVQSFLLDRKKQGFLLALASKNDESDVARVFLRDDMILRREHFVSWKVGWNPKSQSVVELSRDLELGLDSFIFLDDSPVECAEVGANCPAVTTLQLPTDAHRIAPFLHHTWAFDVEGATSVDGQRTELYRQQGERNQYRETAGSFAEFVTGLRLEVRVEPLRPSDYERAAQLSKRTNQFNTTGIRWSEAALASAITAQEREVLIVRVRDRFGDYGEVGLVVYSIADNVLNVETMLMSCRVLGKGAEHRVVAALGERAVQCAARDVHIQFKSLERNQPAQKFLTLIAGEPRGDGRFVMRAEDAASLAFDPTSEVRAEDSEAGVQSAAVPTSRADFGAIAELTTIDAIERAVAKSLQRERISTTELVLPRNSIEARLAHIWESVLHFSPIGVTDSFLSLGGRSLQAAGVVARIANEFGARIPLSALLDDHTIEQLASSIDQVQPTVSPELSRAETPTISAAQQRLAFLDEFIPNRAAYNIPVAKRIRGPFDADRFRSALAAVVDRHAMLRTTYDANQAFVPRISATPTFGWEHLSVQTETQAIDLAGAEASRPFELSAGPLLRCLVVAIRPEDHLVVLNVHHIAADGWSMGILWRDLAEAYSSAAIAHRADGPNAITYFDYAAWQRERVTSGAFESDLVYWRGELAGAPALLELPTDHIRPSILSYRGSCATSVLSGVQRSALEAFAALERCTPFMVLMAAWVAMLHRYSQQDDIVVGTPVAGRTHPSVEDVVGCFVNTVAVRARVDAQASFSRHLQTIRAKVLNALSHQELPFEALISDLDLQRDLSRTPLFQVMLVLQDTPSGEFVAEGLQTTATAIHNRGAKFDLVLEITPRDQEFDLALEFNADLFSAETAARMLRHFRHLVSEAISSPESPVAQLALMDDGEKRDTLSFVNATRATFDDVECLHEWFARSAALYPEAVALTFQDLQLTYRQLNERANQLAHCLIASGVKPDDLVGVYVSRSANLVVAILGVLKAGAGYLPIDLSYPADRVSFMLDDTKAPILLTESALSAQLPATSARTLCFDSGDPDLSAFPVTDPVTAATVDTLAYVIYTSGSTGKPKGCMVTHRNVARLMRATERWYGFNANDVWTLFHSCAFDFSVWEMWGALLYGGRLVVVPYLITRSPEAFYELLANERVTVLNQTPSAFRQLIEAEESAPRDLRLRYVIFGGEALEMQSLAPWFDRHGDTTPLLVNMYGITETTVHVTYRPLARDDVRSASVIGVPLPDLQLYILDPCGQPVPVGVPGEMYVGGAGLARGYLRRPELTGERFVPDVISGQSGARLYRTGDRARFVAGRDVEYLGRIDHQVKIRGFRIELGEIEALLCQHPAVREAIVIAREDEPGVRRLAAYVVTSRAQAPELSQLRDHLKQKLPEYMVPAAFVFLDKLPLTSNGKIDRKALPAPEQQRPELGSNYEAPRNALESTLARIWAKVLRVDRVGIHDNFFELGGDSILSIQVISSARGEGLKLTPKVLFANQTIAELAGATSLVEIPATQPIEVVSGAVPLTPIQRWFFEQNLADANHFNQSFLFEVDGRPVRHHLERALRIVEGHHDGLRLRYGSNGATWRQSYAGSADGPPLEWVDLADVAEASRRHRIETKVAEVQRQLDLTSGPLWRATYFDLGAGTPGRLLLACHHLAVDGVSWRVLLEDLERAYLAVESGKQPQLPQKTASFKQWAERLETYARSETVRRELPFWQGVTSSPDGTPLPNLPGRSSHQVDREGDCETVTARLTEPETRALLQQVPAAYNTQINDVLLTALARAWSLSTDSRTLFINLEGHGREDLGDDVDVSRTVGWFTSIFPVRLEIPGAASTWEPGTALKAVKEQLRRIPHRGIGYGILRYLTPDSALESQGEPSIVFNYLGVLDQVIADSKVFRFARESTGPWHGPNQTRRHALEFNCLVIDGRVELRTTFNPHNQEPAIVGRLTEGFASALRELIAHCVSPSAGGRTPSDFPLARLDQEHLDDLATVCGAIEDVYPLSPIQTLFHSTNSGVETTSFDQWHCTLHGSLDIEAFQRAWQQTLCRHPILRSTIHSDNLPEPLQVVHKDVEPGWRVDDWRSTTPLEQTRRWDELLASDRATPLSMIKAPAMRFTLIRLTADRWKFLWTVPALLLDGWSWPLVFRDVSCLYQAAGGDSSGALDTPRPYRAYLEWLNEHSFDGDRRFWRETLAGFDDPLRLVSRDRGSRSSQDGHEQYAQHPFSLSHEASSSLGAIARKLHLTLNALVQAAWAVLLYRQTARSDVVFGAAFAGRPTDLPGSESIVGPLVNTVPVRLAIDADTTVAELLRTLHRRLLEINSHQFMPLIEIQRCSELPWRHRLFDSVVVFQNYAVDESARRLGARINLTDFVGPVHSNYPIMLLAEPGGETRLTLIYDQRFARSETIGTWSRDLRVLLEGMPALLDVPLSAVREMLSPRTPDTVRRKESSHDDASDYLPPQSPLEKTIAQVWESLFEIDRVSIEANFFDLGGHSLLLIQLHNRLRETLKTEFPIVTLFQHPSVRSFARHLTTSTVSTDTTGEAWRDRAQRQKRALAELQGRMKRNRS